VIPPTTLGCHGEHRLRSEGTMGGAERQSGRAAGRASRRSPTTVTNGTGCTMNAQHMWSTPIDRKATCQAAYGIDSGYPALRI
jgi:hypothetical protein